MRVFVSEYLCSGGLADQPLPPSLAAEGQAMWRAVIEDLVAIEGVTVTTTRDPRVSALEMKGVDEIVVTTPEQEHAAFRHHCSTADAILLIAPELDDELSRRIAKAHYYAKPNTKFWNAPLKFCRLASDKFATWQCLVKRGMPTVPTDLLTEWRGETKGPVVIKPRFGAGSQETFFCKSRTEIDAASDHFAATPVERQAVVQPYVAGRSLSCLVFVNTPHQLDISILTYCPPAEQRLSEDGRFQYLGGRMPAMKVDPERVHRLMSQALDALSAETRSRVEGPIGFDFIESAETGELLIVDVNPRFTTSYLGCRRLAAGNLLAPMTGFESSELSWREGPLTFTVADLAVAH